MKRIREIPEHLKPFIVEQKPELYTALDHESWRYIMRISSAFFKKHAHRKYLDGLKETGVSINRIPLISEMDKKLSRFGWRVVAVSGFIPPSVFLEFQSLGILAIACDMRKLENLAYTPAPDIVHEAAGHAPIISDPAYRKYLLAYGEIARKAIFSASDMEVYEAVRNLSEVKEDPHSTAEQIRAAQKRLDDATANSNYVSEANQLTRMAWWTVEYGLIGDFSNPKIFGAGLLSSVGESFDCFSENIRKIPFSLDCINLSYDITKPQPQLFVVPNFEVLTAALKEYRATMAFARGGVDGLAKAKIGKTTTTVELDSGLQISGILDDFKVDHENRPIFLKYKSPVQLGLGDRQLPDHGPDYHRDGFSSPIGRVKVGAKWKCASLLTHADLAKLGFKKDKTAKLKFESGIELSGLLSGFVKKGTKFIILTFKKCRITFKGEILFDPSWGTFDLACGCEVKSVFGGAADRAAYIHSQNKAPQQMPHQKSNLTSDTEKQVDLHSQVREIRQNKKADLSVSDSLRAAFLESQENCPDDWLIVMNILEILKSRKITAEWEPELRACLEIHQRHSTERRNLIQRGLDLIQ